MILINCSLSQSNHQEKLNTQKYKKKPSDESTSWTLSLLFIYLYRLKEQKTKNYKIDGLEMMIRHKNNERKLKLMEHNFFFAISSLFFF